MNIIQSKSVKFIALMLLVATAGCSRMTDDVEYSQADFQQHLGQRIPDLMDWYEVPGVSVALIKNGKISWSDAYGLADIENEVRMSPKTICRVESISKSVTARGVMKLVEKGEIKLDDPVYVHLKSWEFPESEVDFKKVTIRHLLSHSSGLTLGTIGLEYDPREEKPSLRESLSREVRFEREPRTVFSYSNVGYHLLELLIEDVTGRSFSEYMLNEILIPLKMENASFEWSEDFITPVPNGHNLNGDPVPVYVYSEKGAGGLFANVEDIATFVSSGMLDQYYSDTNVLKEKSIRELYNPLIEAAGIYSLVSENYGLGHFIETLPNGKQAVFSGGQGNGWMTHFHLVPETGDGIVILTNSSRSWPLISHILSDWAEWNGFGSLGMDLIAKATTGLWIVIGLILTVSFLQIVRMIRESIQGKRRFDLQIKNYSGVQYLQLTMALILIFVLIWSLTREYLLISSVFPGASPWLMIALVLVLLTLLLSVLLSKKRSGNVTFK
ncbi:MAG TPA: serine hydrolase domain-containing protein [Balneolaceae bacterium]|nr:serine hydrolase domain-containing protein [Balneolaceae bacterium]